MGERFSRRPMAPKAFRINFIALRGPVIVFDHVDPAELLASGLVKPEQLPGNAPGSNRTFDRFRLRRCRGGRLNAHFDAKLVKALDPGFTRLLRGLLAEHLT